MSQLSKKKHTKKTCLLIAGVSFLFSSCSLDVVKLQEFQCDTFFTYIVYEDHGIAATLTEKVDQLENIGIGFPYRNIKNGIIYLENERGSI